MNTTMLKTNLSRGLAIVGRAVPGGDPMLPILSHVRVEAVNGSTQQVHLAATDLELSIACRFAAKVTDAGTVTLPARTLTDLVATLGDDMLTLQDEQQIKLASSGVTSSLKGLDAADFPDVFGSDGEYEAEIPAAMLLEMAERVVIAAAATDLTRPILTGVLFKIAGGKIIMVAADGFRLSVCTASAQGKGIAVVVPARALNELLRIAKDETEPIRFTVNEARTRAVFHMAGGAGANETMLGIDLITQLVEGNFPDVGAIIPQSHQTRVTMDAGALLEAVKTANIFARNEDHTVALRFTDDGRMIVSGSSAEIGEGVTTLDASIEGAAVEVCLNARFLIDVLKVVDGQIALGFNSSEAPVALRPVADPDGFVHVIMPLRAQ